MGFNLTYGLDVAKLEFISYQGNMKYDFEVGLEHFICRIVLKETNINCFNLVFFVQFFAKITFVTNI
jgi:hypothetical protein